MKTIIAAFLLVFTVACANGSSDSSPSRGIVRGKRISSQEAIAVLTASARWCYDNTTTDAFYGTHVFAKNSQGEFALWNRIQKKYMSRDPMTWQVTDNVLTMTLPKTYKPNVWTTRLLFLDGSVQLWRDDDSLQSVLSPCAPSEVL